MNENMEILERLLNEANVKSVAKHAKGVNKLTQKYRDAEAKYEDLKKNGIGNANLTLADMDPVTEKLIKKINTYKKLNKKYEVKRDKEFDKQATTMAKKGINYVDKIRQKEGELPKELIAKYESKLIEKKKAKAAGTTVKNADQIEIANKNIEDIKKSDRFKDRLIESKTVSEKVNVLSEEVYKSNVKTFMFKEGFNPVELKDYYDTLDFAIMLEEVLLDVEALDGDEIAEVVDKLGFEPVYETGEEEILEEGVKEVAKAGWNKAAGFAKKHATNIPGKIAAAAGIAALAFSAGANGVHKTKAEPHQQAAHEYRMTQAEMENRSNLLKDITIDKVNRGESVSAEEAKANAAEVAKNDAAAKEAAEKAAAADNKAKPHKIMQGVAHAGMTTGGGLMVAAEILRARRDKSKEKGARNLINNARAEADAKAAEVEKLKQKVKDVKKKVAPTTGQ